MIMFCAVRLSPVTGDMGQVHLCCLFWLCLGRGTLACLVPLLGVSLCDPARRVRWLSWRAIYIILSSSALHLFALLLGLHW